MLLAHVVALNLHLRWSMMLLQLPPLSVDVSTFTAADDDGITCECMLLISIFIGICKVILLCDVVGVTAGVTDCSMA